MLLLTVVATFLLQEKPEPVPYARIQALFEKHCISCHDRKEAKAELVLETYEDLLKGDVLVPGKPEESTLFRSVTHAKKPFMPPPKKAPKMSDEEIALVRAWISQGAAGPKAGEAAVRAVAIPRIEPKVAPRKSVHAMAYDPASRLLAIAHAGEVEIRAADTRMLVRTLPVQTGEVNALAFSADGTRLAAAAGEPGVGGEVVLWSVAEGKPLRRFRGHRDAVYAVALSSDGRLLATGGYDQKILLWDTGSDTPLRRLEGHNEAVFDLAFRPDGRILASASADRTVKLWEVATGERRETLSDPTKAVHAVAFSPDGLHVAGAGADNRIRIWQVSADAKEGTNPIQISKFGHEGAILRLVFSRDGKTLATTADDRTVKLWNAADVSLRLALEAQPDWPSAAVFALDDKALAVGRLDGSSQVYEVATGKALAATVPPKPELARILPRGIERGRSAEIRIDGKNLSALTGAAASDPRLQVQVLPGGWLGLTSSPELPLGGVDLWVTSAGGESNRLRVFVDDLPQVAKRDAGEPTRGDMPVSFWGSLQTRGATDTFAVDARKGETLVIDAAAKRLGSKAQLVVTLTDPSGHLLASNIDFEGEADPLLTYSIPRDGRYLIHAGDLELAASNEHFYRLSVGALPVVHAIFPLSVPAHSKTAIRLVGTNLPKDPVVGLVTGDAGEVAVPLDPSRYRARREFKVMVSDLPETLEVEDNDSPRTAVPLPAPGSGNGRIDRPGDVDYWKFESKAGRVWVIETQAAQRGSPVDTRIEVLHADGTPVERLVLQAVRDSWITFRPIDANANGVRLWQWQEMGLGQYLYMQGEVVRLSLAPRGPDSTWDFFSVGGKRRCYFDTSATAHALDEPVYIVEPRPPGSKGLPNGLPAFPLYYSNDDDGDRRMGTDSRLVFTAPADGSYLVRVTDVKHAGGERYVYRLVVRDARPDVRVTVEGAATNVPAGSGLSFVVRAERIDGFDGPVRIDIDGAPAGYSVSTPLFIEAGHTEARGTLFASADAPKPANAALRIRATAQIGGQEVAREIPSPPGLALAARPRTLVWLEPEEATAGDIITLKPGGMVPAKLRIERTGHNERVTFDVENLPFGAIVEDIGLNGILIPEGQTERRIFLTCDKGVQEMTRPVFARIRETPNTTSRPVLVRVPR
jgi:hypothetical protein